MAQIQVRRMSFPRVSYVLEVAPGKALLLILEPNYTID